MPDVVRYLAALEHRVRKAKTEPGRDRQRIAGIQALEHEYRRVAARHDRRDPHDARGAPRSLFAQSVGARGGPSETKVRKALAALT